MKVEEGAVTTLLLTVTSHWTLTTVKCQPTQRKEALGSCEMAGLEFSVKRKKREHFHFKCFQLAYLGSIWICEMGPIEILQLDLFPRLEERKPVVFFRVN